MPLPSVLNGAKQCKVLCKRTGIVCRNPAAYGCISCRMHGAHRPLITPKGINHPNYKHGRETLEAKAKRSAGLTRLRKIEDLMVDGSFYKLHKSKGRKPNGYKKNKV
jgi:hypothetical protein